MQYLTILALPLFAAAAPTAILKRAGAPSKVALPADCPIQSTYPSPNATNFAPTAEYAATALYTFTLSPGSTVPDGTDDAAATQNCLDTCYGYGNPGDCTAVWTGHGANVEEYGSTVYAEFVCKLFAGGMTSDVLGAPNQGDEDANAHALTIGCGPRSE